MTSTTKKRPRKITPKKQARRTTKRPRKNVAVTASDATTVEPTATDQPTDPAADPSPIQQVEHEHYEEIRTLNQEVCEARSAWTIAKDKASGLKKTFDALNYELLQTIRRGPDPQRKLPLDGAANSTTSPSDAWRSVKVSELTISSSTAETLVDNFLSTLGELSDFWKAGNMLTDLVGIGGAKADAVADAFAAYGVEHPKLFGEPEAEDLIDDNDGTVDGEAEDDADDDELLQ